MNKIKEENKLVTVNVSAKIRDAEEIKRILGDVGSVPTCCEGMQCSLCEIMETNLFVLNILCPIIEEICTCFYLQKNMAAVTLTNHLLESAIKFALVFKEGNGKIFDDPAKMDTLFEKECKMYMYEDMGKNIGTLCAKGMITKDQKKRLIQFKNLYRNAYSHASNNAFVEHASTPIAILDSSNPDYIENKKVRVAYNPLFLVNARINFVERTGFGYFQEVVNLVVILDRQIHQLYETNKKTKTTI